MTKDYIKPIEMQVFLAADLEAGFKVVDADGFEWPLSFIRIKNTMDEAVEVSLDGQYAHEYIQRNDSIDLNLQLCCSYLNKSSLLKNKTKVYVRKVDNFPKGGTLVVTGFYQN